MNERPTTSPFSYLKANPRVWNPQVLFPDKPPNVATSNVPYMAYGILFMMVAEKACCFV